MKAELRWLYKVNRGVVVPELIYVNEKGTASGLYYRPERKEYRVGDRYYDFRNGLIVINLNLKVNDKDVGNTISHEWRHHVQFLSGIPFDNHPWVTPENPVDYPDAIVRYFMTSRREMDAHLFALRVCPSDYNLLWNEWIVKEKERKWYQKAHSRKRSG